MATTLLIADADRERATEHIKHAFVDGRLSEDEHEARVDDVLSARTREDLDGALQGIPAQGISVSPSPGWLPDLVVLPLAAFATFGLLCLVLWLFSLAVAPPEEDPPSASEIAAEVKADWRDINQVVKAERKVYAQTGGYTGDWTTLKLAMGSDGPENIYVNVGEGRRGVIIGNEANAYGLSLTASLNGPGRVLRRCSAETAYAGVRCPSERANGKPTKGTREN
jgi:hypothetical protein